MTTYFDCGQCPVSIGCRDRCSKGDPERLRADFERLAKDAQFNFRRSVRGTYVNPAVARDWKWFQLGAIAKEHKP